MVLFTAARRNTSSMSRCPHTSSKQSRLTIVLLYWCDKVTYEEYFARLYRLQEISGPGYGVGCSASCLHALCAVSRIECDGYQGLYFHIGSIRRKAIDYILMITKYLGLQDTLTVAATCHGVRDLIASTQINVNGPVVVNLDETLSIPKQVKMDVPIVSFDGKITGFACRPQSAQIACGVDDSIIIWDASTLCTVYHLHTGCIKSIAWSPNGSQLVSLDSDGCVGVWDSDTGKRLYTLQQDSLCASVVEWSLDGTKLASGYTDGSIRIWDANTLSRHGTYRLMQ